LVHLAAFHNATAEGIEVITQRYPLPLEVSTVPGRVLLERRPVHVVDTQSEDALPIAQKLGRAIGMRSTIAVPMLREAAAVGVLGVGRKETGSFSEGEIEPLKPFADQAVIAIENVRLFKELQARTADLTRSIGELRALGEVSQALSS